MSDKSVFAIIYCPDTERYLLGKRSKDVGNSSTWHFFGGGVDKGEDNITALFRELKEEAGGIKTSFKVSSDKVKFKWKKDKKTVLYKIYVDKEFKPKINKEHTKAKWFTREELEGLNLHPISKIYFSKH